ncbi:MAG: signal recognition particle-docking protein FtsY [Anaerovoracaceae bacterium]|nr:signal recognition particle-docking protein FtsY [Bacillota bacterium]MDY2670270.1 signal recognition particle-docking protein FtsY [Anaerovoracaceae bacterium]
MAKKSFFTKLKEGLTHTRDNMMGRIEEVVKQSPDFGEDMLEDLEEALILSDISMETTEKIVNELRDDIKKLGLKKADDVLQQIKNIISYIITNEYGNELVPDLPLVILMVGVNGTGKTTSMAKIAYRLQQEGKTVMFAAADTFRAAAAEQLEIWGERVGVPVIKHGEGADPSAVIYDACHAAQARGIDVLICDTAGRLQTKKNLMNELEKMSNVISNEYPEAARETLLVLDAATGKNAISQAEQFSEVTDLTGIVLTKLDGTAKGGIVITLADKFDIPVKFIGVGEAMEDLQPFDPDQFADALFSGSVMSERDEEDQREGALFTGKEEEEENDGPEQDAE